MYTLTVKAHIDIEKSWSYIDLQYACDMFTVATKCVDCAYATIIDAMTGEIIKEWHYMNGLTIYTDMGEIHIDM